MSSGDDNSASSGDLPRRKTLVGLGVTQDRLDRLAQAVKDVKAAPPRPTLPTLRPLPPQLPLDAGVDDSAVMHAVDRAWDEIHGTSEVVEVPPEALEELSLDEESLPEPIHEPTPTLEEFKAPPPMPYAGDNVPLAEFEASKTEMVSTPYQSEPTVGRLVTLSGPAAGQEFFAASPRNTVGRGATNTIAVPDLSMSRQHFEIVRNPDDTFMIVDLLSINGTTLNGLRVKEAELRHGDYIDVGSSKFQFIVTGAQSTSTAPRRVTLAEAAFDPRATPPPPAQPAQVSVRALALVAVLVAVLMCVAIALTFLITRSQPPAAEAAPVVSTQTLYLAGVDAVTARDWDRAEEKFREVQALDPTFEGVAAQFDRLEAERRALTLLNDARARLDEGAIPAAVRLLDQVPSDSAYAVDAENLNRDARRTEVLQLYGQAQEAFAQDDLDRTRELLEELLERVPTHVGAQELLARTEAASEAEPEPELEPEPEPEPAAAATHVEPRAATPRTSTPRTTAKPAKQAPAAAADDWITVDTSPAAPEIPVF